MPLVSVCVPTHNAGSYLEHALHSATSQTFRDIEVLVIDNCSTDETQALVGRLASGDRRIRYVRNPANVGMAGNFNRCLELASSEYIKFLCADDLLAPDCVGRMLAAIEARPGIALVASARRLIGPNNEPLGDVRHATRQQLWPGEQALKHCFYRTNIVGEPTAVLFRRNQARRGFDPAYDQAFDLEMWFHLLKQGDLVLLPDALCSIRLHPGQGTSANLRSGRVVDDKRRLFRQFGGRPDGRASMIDRAMWDLRMASSVEQAEPKTARKFIGAGISEVYFPALFRYVMVPAVAFLRRLWGAREG